MFVPDVNIDKFHFKGFSKRGLKFKIYIAVENFILPVKIDELSGNLSIFDRKIKLCFNKIVGECFCYDTIKLRNNKINIIELNLILYWKGIFLIIFPNLFFYSRYKAFIHVINNVVKEASINICFNFKLAMFLNLKYEIYINASGKALCIPINKVIFEKIDKINILKGFCNLVKNKF